MSIYRTFVDRSILVAALAVVFCAPALPADITWDWSYSSNQFTGSGTLTTDSTLTTGVGGFTGYRIVEHVGYFRHRRDPRPDHGVVASRRLPKQR